MRALKLQSLKSSGPGLASIIRQFMTAQAHDLVGSEVEDTVVEVTNRSAVKDFEEMPGPRGLPLIGNALKYSKYGPYSFEKILENRLTYMQKYGKIYKEKLGSMSMVNLFDPTDLATMYRLEGKYPSRGKIANLEVTYLKRNNKLIGFAFLDGPEWARQRSCIQQLMMHPAAAAKYLSWQMPVARDFADYLGGLREEDGLVPNLYENLFKYTMESIGAVCFGDRVGAFGGDTQDAQRLAGSIAETLFCFRSCMFNVPWYQYMRTPMYRRFERAANNMRKIMSKYVNAVEARTTGKRREKARHLSSTVGDSGGRGKGGGCPFSSGRLAADAGAAAEPEVDAAVAQDLMDEQALCVFEMLSSDPRVSDELAVNLVMALFRTGIDSTGNTLAFFLHNLALNPDKQEILYREIEQNLPADGVPTFDTIQNMTYLKACLKESFRLHYPVFGGSGRVMPEDTVFSGYRVPKGVFIFANLAAMSRMDEYFPRPLEYHPERWLRDDRADMTTNWPKDHAYLCLPFSHGLRACPGRRLAEQGLYMAVIAIVQKYRLRCVDKSSLLGMIHMPFTIPDRPLDIQFLPRSREQSTVDLLRTPLGVANLQRGQPSNSP